MAEDASQKKKKTTPASVNTINMKGTSIKDSTGGKDLRSRITQHESFSVLLLCLVSNQTLFCTVQPLRVQHTLFMSNTELPFAFDVFYTFSFVADASK